MAAAEAGEVERIVIYSTDRFTSVLLTVERTPDESDRRDATTQCYLPLLSMSIIRGWTTIVSARSWVLTDDETLVDLTPYWQHLDELQQNRALPMVLESVKFHPANQNIELAVKDDAIQALRDEFRLDDETNR